MNRLYLKDEVYLLINLTTLMLAVRVISVVRFVRSSIACLRFTQVTLVSENIQHYRIIRKLGAGGMGEVYLAEDTRLDRKAALKILPPEFAADPGRMQRFVLEAKSASALNHPNTITIYEIGEA